jgi:hypothetical protein
VDVTNKNNPTQLSRTTYAQDGYTHQGWLSTDQAYFVFGDETDERSVGFNTRTLVMDVMSLTNPSLAGSYFSNNKAVDHNLYILGDYIYQANFRAGMRVLQANDYSDPSTGFTEVAYFDIYPSDDNANFNGAWTAYPYLPSGTVIISGKEQGILMVRVNGLGTSTSSPTTSPVTPSPTMSSQPSETPTTEAPTEAPPPTSSPVTSAPQATPSCGVNKDRCDSPTDCCSNNCSRGSCKGNGRTRMLRGDEEEN